MMDTLIYILASSLLLGMVFLMHHFVLRRTGNHRANRFFLIGMTLAALCLPFTALFKEAGTQFAALSVVEIIDLSGFAAGETAANGSSFSGLWTLYIAGLALGTAILLWHIAQVILLIRAHERVREGKIVRVFAAEKVGVSSFFHYLIWDERLNLPEDERRQLEAHEKCHIQQKHSLDKMLFAILRVLFWFQPMVHLLARELADVHEFLADEAALQEGGPAAYRKLLLRMTAPQYAGLTHTFVTPSIKNRINMMFNNENARNRSFRYFLLMPMVVLMIASAGLFARHNMEPTVLPGGGDVVMPTPQNLGEIIQRVKFPKSLQDSDEIFKVVVKILVDEEGKVDSYEIVQEDHPKVGAEVKKVVKDIVFSPGTKDGKAVKVWVTLPFKFVAPDKE